LENAGIEVEDEKAEFFGILMKYQLAGRYPDYNPTIPDKKKVIEYFQKSKEILSWLKKYYNVNSEVLKAAFGGRNPCRKSIFIWELCQG
jgi:hypothetical protein